MKMIDHGMWRPYKPAKLPEGAPSHALFCKRESDGMDWYEYVNSGKNFAEHSVKISALYQEFWKAWVIGPSVIDATMLHPANQIVREIPDFGSTDEDVLIATFRNKHIDPETNEIRDPPVLPDVEDPAVAALRERLENLEKRVAQWVEDHTPPR
jgi:hypothetical protein